MERVNQLAEYFYRNGYVRQPNLQRMSEGYMTYKKGWEIRLVLDDQSELESIQKMLSEIGFKPGKPFLSILSGFSQFMDEKR